MIIYLLLAAFLAGVGSGGYGVYDYMSGKEARVAQKQREAEDKITALAQQIEVENATRMQARQAAYEQGEQAAQAKEKIVYLKGRDYVQASPQVFTNRDCVLPPTSLQLVNSETADLRAAAAANVFGFGLPDSGGSSGRATGDIVLSPSAKPATVEGVHPQVQPSGGAREVPGSGVQRPPKPSSTGK